MKNIKFFKYTYNINGYKYHGNYQHKIIYKDFEKFKDIKYNGIEIHNKQNYSVKFSIDALTLRKLKILKLGGNITIEEKNILYFIENSVELTRQDFYINYRNNRYYSVRYYDDDIDFYEKYTDKDNFKLQDIYNVNKYKHTIKKYNDRKGFSKQFVI